MDLFKYDCVYLVVTAALESLVKLFFAFHLDTIDPLIYWHYP